MRNGEGEEEEEEGRRSGGGRRGTENRRIENATVDEETAVMETKGFPMKENSSQIQHRTVEGGKGEAVSAPVSFRYA